VRMAKKLWGGRFKKKTNPTAEKFLSSLAYDRKLAEFDCHAGIAHAKMLAKAGLITNGEKNALTRGLNSILSAVKRGKFEYDPAYEDIHTNIQQALKEKIGKAADKLHMARSRNDLVSTETRMFCKKELGGMIAALAKLQRSILSAAKKYKGVVIPAYTHLRHAQVVLLSHYLLAYVEMFERDKKRLKDAIPRLNSSPLGAGAVCGTSLPIDRTALAKELGFARVMENSIDAVSDRDFVIETLSCLSILAMHLSRLSEDLIIFSSDEFKFLEIDEAYCTGSSMMPHKKNPDTLELIRGGSAAVYGNLIAALSMMKGLPLSYNRDMQFDKKFLFDSIELVSQELSVLQGLIKGIGINKGAIARQLSDESLYATDLAEYLMKKGSSHAAAHDAVGKLVSHCARNKKNISGLELTELKRFSKEFDEKAYKILNGGFSVRLKHSSGGTSPGNVERAIKRWEERL